MPGVYEPVIYSVLRIESLHNSNRRLHFVNRFRCKDGAWKTLPWRSQPMPDGTLWREAFYTDDVIQQRSVLDAETPFLQNPFTLATISAQIRGILLQRNAASDV